MVEHRTIPQSVRRAIEIYSAQRRRLGVTTALVAGASVAVAIVLTTMVADRYLLLPQWVRLAGPRLALLSFCGGAAGALFAWRRRHDAFRVTARLDQAFPHNRDRWSSSFDLAEQVDSGRDVGNRVLLDRLFADTESLPPENALEIVPRGAWHAAIAGGITALIALLFVVASPAFDVRLLTRRFFHPHSDLPRDSSTQIVFTEVNDQPFAGVMPGPLPEGSPLNLRVELRRKAGLFAFGQRPRLIDDPEQLPPRLERAADPDGRSTELVRAGSSWSYSLQRLDAPLAFRVRADDGLTQILRVDITPRVKLLGIDTGIHYPRYTRSKDQPIQRLAGNRISALADSVIDFRASYDRALKSMSVTYEAMKPSDKSAAPSDLDRIASQQPKEGAVESSRRELRVQRRGDDAIRFTLPIDTSGILRVRAVGANGLAGEEWVCAVEAIADAPPRIAVTGLEPETTIVPGETVSFQYRAEDDLAVTDVAIDWSVAGGIHSSDLGGDEYFRSSQLGQKVVAGQQLIQRMDYKFYATEPFQFFLTAVDSKGQESHTEIFRIHTVSDDYATRFARGMELLKDAGAYQQRFVQQLSGMMGQLNIIATAAGDAHKWDAKLDPQLENFLRSAQNYDDPWFFVKLFELRYGGVPYRLDQALQMVLSPPESLASRADFVMLGLSMKSTDDLPGVIHNLRALADGQKPVLEAWGKAIETENARFLLERLLNMARGPASRLSALGRIQQAPDVAAANLKFNLTQIDAWMTAAAPLAAEPALMPLLATLKSAREAEKADAVVAALLPIIDVLSSRELAVDDSLGRLAAAMAQPAPAVSEPQDRFPTAAARLVFGTGRGELLRPAAAMTIAQPWLSGTPNPGWYPAPPSVADLIAMSHQVWSTLRDDRADMLTRRLALNPQEAADREVILRERALATRALLRQMPPGAIDAGVREKLDTALGRAAKLASSDAELPNDLQSAIRALGTAPLVELGSQAQTSVDRFLATLRKTADEYEQHAQRATQQAALPPTDGEPFFPARMLLLDQASRLQTRTEGLESLYRAMKLAMAEARLLQPGPPPQWAYFEPYHGVQLAMSLAASQASEGVVRIHVELANQPAKASALYPVAARNALQLAARLRLAAQLLETAAHGQPVTFDYAQLMKDARAEGLLGTLRDEYERVRACLDGADVATAVAPQPAVNATTSPATASTMPVTMPDRSIITRIVRAEQALAPLSELEQQLRSAAGGKCGEVSIALKTVQTASAAGATSHPMDGLSAALAEAAGSPPDAPVASRPALVRQLQAVIDSLAGVNDGLRDEARLPALSTTGQQNRRFTTRELPNVWVVQGVIDGFDRRWLYTMRDTELSLARTLLSVARPASGAAPDPRAAADATDAKLQYGQMLEWRARNFANDQRRNQGISLLAASNGPTLKLPDHIADEFFRARNSLPDEEFKPRIEAYYEELYRDLAK